MKNVIERVRTVIYLIMCILFTILIYIYLDEILLKSSDSWLMGSIIIICIILADYFSRRYITNLFAFFAIHLFLIGGAAFIPSSPIDKILLGGTAFSFLLLAIGFWRTESNERSMYVIDIPFELILFFILIYFHSSISKTMGNGVASYAYIAGIAYFILYFVREYLDKFLSYSMSSGNFSKELINTFSTNLSLIMLFNVITIFAIMTANMFFSNSMFNIIGRFFHFLAKKFFGLFSVFDNTGEPSAEKIPEMPDSQTSTMPSEPTYSHTSDSSNIGSIIFQVFIAIIFVALIIIVFYIIYSFIKQYMHRNNTSGDVIEKTHSKEKSVKAEKKGSASPKSFFGTNRDKIRKIYADTVNSVTKRNNKIVIRKSYTPDEIKNAVSSDEMINPENMQKLTKIYEKARYSDSEISKEELDSVKHSK